MEIAIGVEIETHREQVNPKGNKGPLSSEDPGKHWVDEVVYDLHLKRLVSVHSADKGAKGLLTRQKAEQSQRAYCSRAGVLLHFQVFRY